MKVSRSFDGTYLFACAPIWRPVIATELPCTCHHALRIEPERIQGDDRNPVTTQLDFLQLRVIPLLARELGLIPEILVSELVSDGGLQLLGGENLERGLGDEDGRPGKECRRRAADPQDLDVDGGLPLVIRRSARECAA